MSESRAPIQTIIRFGAFELDAASGELRKRGKRVRLQPQPFRVLLLLASRPGKLITRDDLKHEIWNGSVFVDFEQGLNFCIRRIRAALDDDPNSPKFVETVPRRGYRFIADVDTVEPEAATGDSGSASPPIPGALEQASRTRQFHTWMPTIIGVALVLTALATLLVRWRQPRTASSLSERRLTANPDENPVLGAAMSPDGRHLAYADFTGFYVKEVDSGETRLLKLTDGLAAVPDSWLPDSTHIVLSSIPHPGQKSTLWKISILGGTPQALVEDGFGAAVSPDGQRIAFLRGGPDHDRFGHQVWVMDLSDGSLHRLAPNERQVASGSADPNSNGETSWFTSVVWSPNGGQVAYTELSLGPKHAAASIKIQGAAHADPAYIFLSDLKLQPSIYWSPDNRLLYAQRDGNDASEAELWSIAVDPATGLPKGGPKRLSIFGNFERIFATADAHTLMLLRAEATDQLFLSELLRPNQWTALRRMSLDQRTNTLWAWTPDSRSILFTSDRNGRSQLFRQAIDQPTPELLVSSPRTIRIARTLPDGTGVLFSEMASPFPAGPIALKQVAFTGGQPRKVLEESGINNFQCARLPSRLCVFEQTKDNEDSLFAYDTVSGSTRKLTKLTNETYGVDWDFSPDGKRVAVMLPQGRIRIFDVVSKHDNEVAVETRKQLHTIVWTADSGSVLTVGTDPQGNSAVLQVDLNGEAHELFMAPKNLPLDWVIPSPDGKYLAAMGQAGQRNVWLETGF